jgi:hypothetical protein
MSCPQIETIRLSNPHYFLKKQIYLVSTCYDNSSIYGYSGLNNADSNLLQEDMSASSGAKGVCTKCDHVNNEHNTYTCEAAGCRKKFKVCQTGSHTGTISGTYVLCKACPDHPYSCSMVDIHNIKRL